MEFSSMGTRPRLGASASPDPEENSPVAWAKGQGQRLESLRAPPPSAPCPPTSSCILFMWRDVT